MVRGLGKGHCDRHPLVTQSASGGVTLSGGGHSLCRRLHRREQPSTTTARWGHAKLGNHNEVITFETDGAWWWWWCGPVC